jgi:hypothetical protein
MSDLTAPSDVADLSGLSDAELCERLTELEREEQAISRRRTKLHTLIDFRRAGGSATTDPTLEPLEPLEAAERELSDHRLELHAQIDALRAERSVRRI